MIEVILGDSMQIMAGMVEKRVAGFDMIFIDPPYFNWSRTANVGQDMPNHNTLSFYCHRLLKDSGTVWLCGTQPNILEQWRFWSRLFNFNFELIWFKQMGTMAIGPKKALPTHENIWCLYKRDAKFEDIKVDMRTSEGRMYKRKGRPQDQFTAMKTRDGEFEEWRIGANYIRSVFQHPPIREVSTEYYGHPTQKPLRLVRSIVKAATEEDAWVLDPFAGSGTTAQACYELVRNSINIEINPDYIKMIRKRLELCKAITKLTQF